MANLAELKGLKVYFYDQRDRRFIRAVEDMEFEVEEGSIMGLVGESGCGKTITARALMGLIDSYPGLIGGKFYFRPRPEDTLELVRNIRRGVSREKTHSRDVQYGSGSQKKPYKKDGMFDLFYGIEEFVTFKKKPFTIIKDTEKWLRRMDRIMENIRGKNIAIVFQNPGLSLNPYIPVGLQFEKTLRRFNPGLKREEIRSRMLELFNSVKLYPGEKIIGMYPPSLSVGMAQRVVIAIAISSSPKLLIADEPTTGLDTSNRIRIIDLLLSLVNEKALTMIFISHNIGLVGSVADSITVMYAGYAVERGSNSVVIMSKKGPNHPYTEALLEVIPEESEIIAGRRLKVIEGNVPGNKIEIKGCPFMPRCRYAKGKLAKLCENEKPELYEVEPEHFIRCFLFRE
ncbi:MAG: hypothetical protein DRP54_06270 [Spirochaetes bacterium]|nr:MAG: hypothetical protein DRP54_06270 [Spirochaetota bacterium]